MPRFLIDLEGDEDAPANPNGWFVLDTERDNAAVPDCTGLTYAEADSLQQDCENLGDDAWNA
jgi:hypothetical protein